MPKSLKECIPADEPIKAAVNKPQQVQNIGTPAAASVDKKKNVAADNKSTKEQESQKAAQSTEHKQAATKATDQTGRQTQK